MFKHLLFTCALLTAGSTLLASDSATVSGTVFDRSGAVVKDAKVILHRTNGSAVVNALSDSAGHFSFPSLLAGDYLLEATAPGLTLRESQDLHLVTGERKELRLELQISALTTLVSVTSSGVPQPIDQVSKSLSDVDVSESQQRGLISVGDALQFVPGLQVSTQGGPGAFTSIQTRGLRVTDTAVLIDGFPFRDPTSIQDEASAYIGNLFLVDSSHIEVLRGSGSSLYGSNAMSGTVNILTDSGVAPSMAISTCKAVAWASSTVSPKSPAALGTSASTIPPAYQISASSKALPIQAPPAIGAGREALNFFCAPTCAPPLQSSAIKAICN